MDYCDVERISVKGMSPEEVQVIGAITIDSSL